MFIPHVKGGWIVEADYKQIEARIAAFLANDLPTLQVFDAFDNSRGPDPHTVNANDLFGLHGEGCSCSKLTLNRKPTKRERTLAKNFLYGGILYGGEPSTIHAVLSVDTPIELTTVEALISRYLAKHPALPKWHHTLVRNANDNGYVEEPVSGRRRHFWGRIKPTEVYNFPVQTLAGWVINQAIKKVHKELRWGEEGISFQVHDALVLDGPDPLRLAEILKGTMDYILNWEGRKMRFPVDISVGRAWAPSKEMSFDEISKL